MSFWVNQRIRFRLEEASDVNDRAEGVQTGAVIFERAEYTRTREIKLVSTVVAPQDRLAM